MTNSLYAQVDVLTLPIRFVPNSSNHTFGLPVTDVMSPGPELGLGSGPHSTYEPAPGNTPGITWASLFPLSSVNHKLPSGALVIPNGVAFDVGIGFSVTTPGANVGGPPMPGNGLPTVEYLQPATMRAKSAAMAADVVRADGRIR